MRAYPAAGLGASAQADSTFTIHRKREALWNGERERWAYGTIALTGRPRLWFTPTVSRNNMLLYEHERKGCR